MDSLWMQLERSTYDNHHHEAPPTDDGEIHVYLETESHETHHPETPELEFNDVTANMLDGLLRPVPSGHVLVFKVAQTTSSNNATLQPVIEKEMDALTPTELRVHAKDVINAKRKELRNWHALGTFRKRPRQTAKNVVDSRWVIRWKNVGGVRSIKARLTVKGFKDLQGNHVETYAGTASRWGQRLIVSIAAMKRWTLFSADVGSAFLKGLTFEQLAEIGGSEIRQVCFTPPPDAITLVRELDGYNDYDSSFVLELLRPGFGLKDAPRLWRLRLDMMLRRTGGTPLQADHNIYQWRNKNELLMVVSTHVDDFKGAGLESVRKAVFQALRDEFGDIKMEESRFDHCGITHETLKNGIAMHQESYLKQLRCINEDLLKSSKDDVLLPPDHSKQFATLLGALAWLTITRPDIAIFVSALQRSSKAPTVIHLKRLNTVLRWCKRSPCSLLYRFDLKGPLRIVAINDSAFRKEQKSGLAMRGSVIAINQLSDNSPGGVHHILEFYARKQRQVRRSTLSAEQGAMIDGVNLAIVISSAVTELLHGTMSPTAMMDNVNGKKSSQLLPVETVTDAKSLYDSLANPNSRVATEETLVFGTQYLKDVAARGLLRRIWVGTHCRHAGRQL